MDALAVWLTSYRRPAFLRQTLDSIFRQADIPADVFVVDNASTAETRAVIEAEGRIARAWFLEENRGLNWPVENLLPTVLRHRFVMPCDHDCFQARPLSVYLAVLLARPDIGIATGVYGPEWPAAGYFDHGGDRWEVKPCERGGCMVLAADLLGSFFPLPKAPVGFDSHCMGCLARTGRQVAVLPGGVVHLGWRKGDSTWQPEEIPERFILDEAGNVIARP